MQGRLKRFRDPRGSRVEDEIRSTVNAAIDALPEDLRTAIVLRELEGLSYEEIAAPWPCPWGPCARASSERAGPSTRRLREVFEVASAVRRNSDDESSTAVIGHVRRRAGAGECELLARRCRARATEARWGRYAVVGAAIRSERGRTVNAPLAGLVSAVIPGRAGARRGARRAAHRGALVAAGGGGPLVAAGVAAVSVLWFARPGPACRGP